MSVEHVAFDFVERCNQCHKPSDLLDDLLSCIRLFGFEHLILSGVPVANQKLAPLVELNGWPDGWFERYVSEDHAKRDGVCLWSARSIHPFFWNDIPKPLLEAEGSVRVANEATAFGIRSGYAVPLQSRQHWQAVVSMASPIQKLELPSRDLAAITMMAAYAASAVEALLFPPTEEMVLSTREREILQWYAAGKSAWEISEILSISERTVEKHNERIRERFGVATTRQAVVEAIRQREIFP